MKGHIPIIFNLPIRLYRSGKFGKDMNIIMNSTVLPRRYFQFKALLFFTLLIGRRPVWGTCRGSLAIWRAWKTPSDLLYKHISVCLDNLVYFYGRFSLSCVERQRHRRRAGFTVVFCSDAFQFPLASDFFQAAMAVGGIFLADNPYCPCFLDFDRL